MSGRDSGEAGGRWPDGKRFAFAIVDDTDHGVRRNLEPVYELLDRHGLKATKTVWVYPPRDCFQGGSLSDPDYLGFVRGLQDRGFEIALHGVGSGRYTRGEILAGLETFRERLGSYPSMHVNHSRNADNLYWGAKRFVSPLRWLVRLGQRTRFSGEQAGSAHFWGDVAKQRIRYVRNHVFGGIVTERYDPRMPYAVPWKSTCSNEWFSASNGATVREFTALLGEASLARLEASGGFSIVYTHFAAGFVRRDGRVEPRFAEGVARLARRPGWFVPAGTLLDHLKRRRAASSVASYAYLARLDARWALDRVLDATRKGAARCAASPES